MPHLNTSSAPTQQLRFLIVDDYEDIRDVFSRYVERAGHLASTAYDGQRAVEVLQEQSFDVMLLDFTMPRMDGAAVMRWLSAHPEVAPHMRTVMVTAWALDHSSAVEGLGVDMVLGKPLKLREFGQVVDLALRDRESSTLVS